MFKTVLLVCAQALFVQSIAGQCMGRHGTTHLVTTPSCSATHFTAPLALTAPSSNCGHSITSIPASSGGGLEVFSASALSPEGLSVLSENAFEGNLAVAGALPFLGAVALEGALPSAGVGAVNYGCGNGQVAILAEDLAPSAFAGPLSYGVGSRAATETIGYGNIGYSLGSSTRSFGAGCGCGSIN
ncbi:chorion class B protein PC10-like [Melitaea cinxia]|uniref:chorion class B protein PC10-like n=1 Tax=Melitaea cinxia TaxID=113334 RepID=UPI001E272036|nr:chorion class B protein PC10-like [Melitaea cinxia]